MDTMAQDTVIMDDFNCDLPLKFMLNIMDGTPMKIDFKGGATEFNSKFLIITSNKHPKNWYKNVSNEHRIALFRRIDECYYHERDKNPVDQIEILKKYIESLKETEYNNNWTNENQSELDNGIDYDKIEKFVSESEIINEYKKDKPKPKEITYESEPEKIIVRDNENKTKEIVKEINKFTLAEKKEIIKLKEEISKLKEPIELEKIKKEDETYNKHYNQTIRPIINRKKKMSNIKKSVVLENQCKKGSHPDNIDSKNTNN